MRLNTMIVALAIMTVGCGGSGEPKDTTAAKSTPAAEERPATSTEEAPKKPGSSPTTDKPAEKPAEKAPASDKKIVIKTSQGKTATFATDHDPWADKVVSYIPGNPKPKLANDFAAVLGKPDFTNRKDPTKYLALGYGGELVVEFTDNLLVDGPGDDLAVFGAGPLKLVQVFISADGKSWIPLGGLEAKRTTVDIGPAITPGQKFRFVKLQDTKAGKPNATGAEIDAIGAINSIENK